VNLSINGQVLLHIYVIVIGGCIIDKIDELISVPRFIELLHL